MSANDGVGMNDEKSFPPRIIQVGDKAHDESIRRSILEPWGGALGDLELLSEEQVFKADLGSCSE
jgi:hypothetical protein